MTPPTWPLAAATGPWRVAGSDFREAQRVLLGEFPDLPAVAELPDRGVGADAVGRTASRLAEVTSDLSVETTPNGWRLAAAPGRDVRRGTSLHRSDLDDLEELAQGLDAPLVYGLTGPWTLAARIELAHGERVVSDPGAARELAAALAEVAATAVADLARRLPGARPVLRLDEPELAAVLAGSLPTQSGWGRLRPVAEPDVVAALGAVVRAAGVPVLLRAPGVPGSVAAGAGAGSSWVGVDERLEPDDLGPWLDAGNACVLEVRLSDAPDRVARAMRRLTALAVDVGLDLQRLLARAALAPPPDTGHAGAVKVAGERLGELARAIRTEVAGDE